MLKMTQIIKLKLWRLAMDKVFEYEFKHYYYSFIWIINTHIKQCLKFM